MEELDSDEYYDILLDVIEIYSELQEYKKALVICKMVLDSEYIEDKSIIMLKIGILYGNQNRKDKETAAYIKALKMNPNNNKVRFRLSELYESQGKIKEALEILEVIKKSSNVKDDSITSEQFEVKMEDGTGSPVKTQK
jgi:tetratricopeptide (TPR) repeat protein